MGGEIGVCGTCTDARGIADAELAEGCRRSTLAELSDWRGLLIVHLVLVRRILEPG